MRSFHLHSLSLSVLALLASSTSASARDDSMERAIAAALRPVGIADMELFTPTFLIAGHRFAVPPVTVVETGEQTYMLSGTLTHQANSKDDCETVEFRISKRRGGAPVVTAECRWQGGAWKPLAAPLAQALASFRTGRTLTPEQQAAHRRTALDAFTRSLNGTRNRAAEFFIARLALGDGC